MKSPVIDRESAPTVLGVDFDEAFAESYVAPSIVLLRLNSSSYNRIDSDNRHKKEDPAGLKRFRSRPEERTLFVDCMPQS